MLNNKRILITGGTGSFGRAFTKLILERYPTIPRIVILSRDEQKQYQMAMDYPEDKFPALRFFIGDVRDHRRLLSAFEGIDIVIHAAAMKHVHLAEYNPSECVKTNVLGAENVISAAISTGVQKVIALSTDKAAAPINLYGATKLTSDKLFIAANNIKGSRDIQLSVVRYGNVMGSNGSVIPFFIKEREKGVLPITDNNMSRFNISLRESCEMVLYAIENAWGGEIFVPKIPSYRILDLAEAIGPDCKKVEVGIRAGEKLHEELITTSDSFHTFDIGKYYVILPPRPIFEIEKFCKYFNGKHVPSFFSYNSGTNTQWETVESLRQLIKEHVDPNFTI